MIVTNVLNDSFEIVIPEDWHGLTIQQLFKDIFKSPKKLTHQFRMNKKVYVNNIIANWVKPISAGDLLQLKIFTNEPLPVKCAHELPEVIFEDEHLIIVNKRAGITTHPNNDEDNTLANMVAFYLQQKGEFRHFRHIHRLDKNTSGLVIFSKHQLAGAILDKMLAEQTIKRYYVTLIHGILKNNEGIIDNPIGRDRHHPTKRRVSKTGQTALTKYKVLKTFHDYNKTLVQCELKTGRTHQIRVHFSHIGHPLIGDTLYGGGELVPRQALHAIKVEFTHPFTNEQVICTAPFLDNPAIFPNQINYYSDI